MQWIKKLFFGQPDHQPIAKGSTAPDATLDELVQANIDLGADIDRIRGIRKTIKARIDALIAERDAPKETT